MALKWFEGFEVDSTTTALGHKYENTSFTAISSFPTGRYGGKGFGRSTADSTGNFFRIRTPQLGDHGTWIVAFDLYAAELDLDSYVSIQKAASEQMKFQMLDTGDGTGNWYVLATCAGIELCRTPAIQRQSWHRVELKVVIDWVTSGPTGSVEIRVDEATLATATGVRTGQLASGLANQVEFKVDITSASTSEGVIDNIVILDGAAETITFDGFTVSTADFLGDAAVEGMYVEAAGSASGFSPTGASPNFACVDDVDARNDDTDYVSSSGNAVIDEYATQGPRVVNGYMLGVQMGVHARVASAGLRTIKHSVRSGARTADAGRDVTSTTYVHTWSVWPSNPSTGKAWTSEELDAVEIGQELV